MNRFDKEFWDGARESALAVYNYLEELDRVGRPASDEIRIFARQLLKETGDRKNKEFREVMGLMPPPLVQR
jgi:hypothetical protein